MGFVDEKAKEDPHGMLASIKTRPEHIDELAKLVEQNTINRATAKQILGQMVKTGEMPSQLVKKMQASKINDAGALEQAIDAVFSAEAEAVTDAKKNPAAANFLLGKVMQHTRGRADPKTTLELIHRKLKES